jgi:hypothetical protein
MTYEDSTPWPEAADGYGRTLELSAETADPSIPGSWFAGCIGGSPGTAYTPCTEKIILSEINYKSSADADAGDWIVLYNSGTASINISGWVFSDSDNSHLYSVPAGTVLSASGYIVLYSDAAKFSSRFPNVTNITGPFIFGLSSTGEALRLFDASGRLYQSVVYDTAAPWPQGAAGNGYTLEIANRIGNFCDGSSWTIGCLEGSPGGPLTIPCSTTGLESVDGHLQVKVFPNPTSGKFNIQVEAAGQEYAEIGLEIFNLLGEKVYGSSNRYEPTPVVVDLANVTGGLYMIKIYLQDKILTTKIMIDHAGL